MYPWLPRIIALPASAQAFMRAGALSAALALVLVAAKLVKLPSAAPDALFDGTMGDLVAVAWSIAYHEFVGAWLTRLAVCVLLVAILIYLVARSRLRQHAVAFVAVGAVLLVYAGTGAVGLLSGDPQPWSSIMFRQSAIEFGQAVSLWWPDVLVVALFFASLSACYTAQHGAWRRVARAAAIALIAVVFVVVALDFAYFMGTRTQLTLDEMVYAAAAPIDALVAGKDSVSMWVASSVAFVAATLFAALVAGRYVLARADTRTAEVYRVGAILWPALVLVLAAPPAPATLALQQFGDNAITRLASEVFVYPILRFAATSGGVSASRRVPMLQTTPMSVVRTAETRPLNVVIVMLESVRADMTSVYAPERESTPFLTELAAESLVVDQMYAVVPRTASAWIASLAGRYPATVKVLRRWTSGPHAPLLDSSLPRLLRSEGYASAWFTPTRMDFENDRDILQALGYDTVVSEEDLGLAKSSRINAWGQDDTSILEPLSRWLDARDESRPFLLTLMTNAAHYPYDLPEGTPVESFRARSPEEGRYLQSVHYLDGLVRQIVGALRERELLEQSIVVVMGDHGEAFYEHGDFTHFRVVYEEALRIPMVIRLPAVLDKRGRIGGLRQQIDLVPTLLDALGLELRGGPLPGRSLLRENEGHEALFFSTHFDSTNIAMRDGALKYIYDFGRRPMQVYDLSTDPAERTDIAATLSTHDRAQVEQDLIEWRKRVRETFESRGER